MRADMFENFREVAFAYGGKDYKIETGRIARQATGSVIVSVDNTRILATVVGQKKADPGRDFFPLTVNYQERFYAGGRIPGSFFRREGRPTDKETLTSRLIDRPLRPLFPENFTNEVQVVITVVSSDKNFDPDIPSMLAASAALAVSGIPFDGPIGAARVGWIDSELCINPTADQMENSYLDMVVAGTSEAVLMVESEAYGLSEQAMLDAVLHAHKEMQVPITAIKELRSKVNVDEWERPVSESYDTEQSRIEALIGEELRQAYSLVNKSERSEAVSNIHRRVLEEFADEFGGDEVSKVLKKMEKTIVRGRILRGEDRIDGRNTTTVRPIDIEVGILPAAHGSVLFTRGETQSIVSATLGSEKMAPLVEGLDGIQFPAFMLHYNFPPFSVGEVGFMGGPKRREVGHGRLAHRALNPVMPSKDDFPYTVRVVSDITESNGSSSMASVCGASMAMMDAGIPISDAVAGVAMGLVKEEDKFVVLTDILGDEDHLGDMDFKVAGTAKGITALQMDIKINGITGEIMERALEQALHARLHILDEMNKAIDMARASLPDHAPQILTIEVPTDRIGDVIGKSGVNIKKIQQTTGVEINIDDDGIVSIYGDSAQTRQEAKEMVEILVTDPEIGEIYEGTVITIASYGAFVNILPGKDGLVHISEIAPGRVEKVEDYLSVGQTVQVKVTDIDEKGRVNLSIKACDPNASDESDASGGAEFVPEQQAEVGKIYSGTVNNLTSYGAFVNILPGKDGLVHISEISEGRIDRVEDYLKVDQTVDVKVIGIDDKGRIKLSMRQVNTDTGADPQYQGNPNANDQSPEEPEDLPELVVGNVYEGKVDKITSYGAFVNLLPNKDGMIHISEITTERVEDIRDYFSVGEIVKVKLINIDDRGRVSLSVKQLNS